MNFPLPSNEAERLLALKKYEILDTPPEAAFERLAQLAARLFQVPVALVSLMDENRQWFKSCFGVDISETPRDIAFCAYAILSNEVMVVPDATQDERFANNPLVTGPLAVRFYAGAPLQIADGLNLGTLCILDTVPRQLSESEISTLQDLAAVVVEQLELRLAARQIQAEIAERERAQAALRQAHDELEQRVAERTAELSQANSVLQKEISDRQRTEAALRDSENRFRSVAQSATDAIVSANDQGQIIFWNKGAHDMFGYSEAEALGLSLSILMPQSYREAHHAGMTRYLATREARVVGKTVEVVAQRKDGSEFPIELSLATWEVNGETFFSGIIRDITMRKQAEEALQGARDQLQAVLDAVPGGVSWIDADSKYLGVNRHLAAMFKRQPEDFMGQPVGFIEGDSSFNQFIHAFMSSSDQAALREVEMQVPAAQELLQGLTGGQGYVQSGNHNNSSTYMVVAQKYQKGQAAVFVGFDISQRKEAEAALQRANDELELRVQERTAELADVVNALRGEITERERAEAALSGAVRENSQLAAAINNASVGVLITDPNLPDNPTIFANPAFTAITDYTQEEIIGLNCRFLQGPDTDPVAVQQVREAIAQRRPLTITLLNYRKDGTPFWNELTVNPVFDNTGKLINFIGIQNDVTARVRAEESLRESEQRFRLLVENVGEIFWMTNAENNQILYISPAYEKVWGRTCQSLVEHPKSFTEAIHPDDKERVFAALRRQSHSGYDEEFQIVRPDGSVRWIRDRSFPIQDASGQVYRIAGLAVDITERRKVEERMRRAKDEAERANRAKSEFLSRMSHELRTPLNAILGFTQLLAMDERPAQERENLDFILKAGQHLLELVNEVLDITRIETGGLSLSMEPVHIGESLQEAIQLVRPLAANNNIELEAPQDCDLFILADRQRLKQVLLNLINNAIKYNRDAGKVILSCERGTEGQCHIQVKDTGFGIASEKMERLFTPFERLGAEQTQIEGNGIGLALSKRLVEVMGGIIHVESVVGQGSVFCVDLPVTQGPDLQETSDHSNTIQHAALNTQHTIHTVLYIEDNLTNLHLIERLFARRSDIHLITAMQGDLGLELAQAQNPSLILLDLHLPDQPGDKVLQQLLDNPRTSDIPVVILSADATPKRVEQLLAIGAQAYLTKPLQVSNFMLILEEILHEK